MASIFFPAISATGRVRQARASVMEMLPRRAGFAGWLNKYFFGARFSGIVREGVYHLKPLALTFNPDRKSLTDPSLQELRRTAADLGHRAVFEAARTSGWHFTDFEDHLSPFGRTNCLSALRTFPGKKDYDPSGLWTIQEAAREYGELSQRAVAEHIQRLAAASPSSQTFLVNLSLDQKTLALSIS